MSNPENNKENCSPDTSSLIQDAQVLLERSGDLKPKKRKTSYKARKPIILQRRNSLGNSNVTSHIKKESDSSNGSSQSLWNNYSSNKEISQTLHETKKSYSAKSENNQLENVIKCNDKSNLTEKQNIVSSFVDEEKVNPQFTKKLPETSKHSSNSYNSSKTKHYANKKTTNFKPISKKILPDNKLNVLANGFVSSNMKQVASNMPFSIQPHNIVHNGLLKTHPYMSDCHQIFTLEQTSLDSNSKRFILIPYYNIIIHTIIYLFSIYSRGGN